MWSGEKPKKTRGLFKFDSLQQFGNPDFSNVNVNSGGSVLILKPEQAIDVSFSRSRGVGLVSSPVPVGMPQLVPYEGVSLSSPTTEATSTLTTIAVAPAGESKFPVAPVADISISRPTFTDLNKDDLRDILGIQQSQKAHMELVKKQFYTQQTVIENNRNCTYQQLENIRESANQQFHAQQELMESIRDGTNKQIIKLDDKIQQVRNDVSIGFQNLDKKTERNADSIAEVKDEMGMYQRGLIIIDEYTNQKFQEEYESKEKLQLRCTTLEKRVNMLEEKETLRLKIMKGATRTRASTTSTEHSSKEKPGRGRPPSRKKCMLCKNDFNKKCLKLHKCTVG